MRRAQDRARSARSRKNGARSATFKNFGARSATIEYYGARSATIESRALGALKLASEASCARSAGRFFLISADTLFQYLDACPIVKSQVYYLLISRYCGLLSIFLRVVKHLDINSKHQFFSVHLIVIADRWPIGGDLLLRRKLDIGK